MTGITPLFIASFAATVAAMALLAAGGSRSVKSAGDYSLAGRQAGTWRVAGAIMGTLVGGASTVGTVQVAYLFGLSGWWFTLGAGLACLFLGLTLAVPLREAEVTTIPQFVARSYGERARTAASLFTALGMFVHVVGQLLACQALLSALFGAGPKTGAFVSALLAAVIALSGGMRGAGSFGLAKLFLLYVTMAAAGWMAFDATGGWDGLSRTFPPFPWFSLFGYGVSEGLSDLLAMLAGVISTQTYLQALFTARDGRIARRGALVSALLIPPLGLLGVAVGLAMRGARPGIDSAQALPLFIMDNFPPALAGIAFAALLVAALGTAAGLILGVGTTLSVDLLARWWGDGEAGAGRMRLVTLVVLLGALGLLLANLGSVIIEWSFLSMGLRGATLCLPLLASLALGKRAPTRGGAVAIVAAPLAVIVAGAAGWTAIPPLWAGLLVSLGALLAGLVLEWRAGK